MVKFLDMDDAKIRVCVVGMGYVGLPLAVALSKHFDVTGLDISEEKIALLKEGKDPCGELSSEELAAAKIGFSSDPASMKECSFIIVAVPTPITDDNKPDLTLIRKASETVGKNLSRGAIVVFESTVYPGVTEEVALPIIEEHSGLKCGSEWKIGYSPERINPGDKEHTIGNVVKIVSGMDSGTCERVAAVYSMITEVYKAESIKVAEAAKVIENIQRDLNIALMNELSLIFRKMDIDTQAVLKAAGTKWNFHKYRPGLVGGHCIGVDPYYLTFKAQQLGYEPEVILAGRRINDSMAGRVAELAEQKLVKAGVAMGKAKVLILGLTFKENVKDARNSKVKDLISALKGKGAEVLAYDPLLSQQDIDHEGFGVKNTPLESIGSQGSAEGGVGKVDCIILAVPHARFARMKLRDYDRFYADQYKKILVDVAGLYDRTDAGKQEFTYVRL